MCKAIAFHLQKGGVGKTTISGTLACQSAIDGEKTLIIDMDSQGNASSWFLKNSPAYELADVVQGRCHYSSAIVPVPQVPNLFIIPTFGIGGSLKNYSETRLSDEPFIFQDLIGELKKSGEYTRIVLDLSPGLGRLERCALISADEVVTPMTAELFSLDGLEMFVAELDRIKKNMRSEVNHSKIVINSFDGRIKQHRDIYEASCKGSYRVYRIPVDPIFRKAQEACAAPQLFRSHGRGMKEESAETFKALEQDIWGSGGR